MLTYIYTKYTCIDTYIWIRIDTYTSMYRYIRAYIHAYVHTYIHKVQTKSSCRQGKEFHTLNKGTCIHTNPHTHTYNHT